MPLHVSRGKIYMHIHIDFATNLNTVITTWSLNTSDGTIEKDEEVV